MSDNEFSQQTSTLALALYQFAMRHTQNPEDANDLVQDTMMKAFQYYMQFETGSNHKAWLT